ncbi:65-kDa microtubule-associated protein 3-like isoform X2 [Salvia splendens]|uniref:65-kDa microtubule-associated protein 3-like isoform X2 n=1 Tax=Salvia splendens TaxID=180675 RepID=UPI001C25D252|nr:65-kDa microtubule-associated protein 3-like isoform X2 [Salvia splendens]
MSACQGNVLLRMQSAFRSLLYELQLIWEEIGESDDERDKAIVELEQECLEVFRRKVDQANMRRAQLRLAIADAEAELAAICSEIGEQPVHIRQAELRMIQPLIEELRKRKNARKNQVSEILAEMQSIKNEICSSNGVSSNEPQTIEPDLSIKKLEELHRDLRALQMEKKKCQKMTQGRLNSLHSLCVVLGLDFKKVANEIHPSLGEAKSSKYISNSTIEQLGPAIQQLRELKLQRMQQLQDLTASLLELWNLMDTPIEEQQIFQKVTCKLAASEDEITEPNMLSIDHINCVEAEVSRLEELKESKMKELVLKKRAELEAICKKTHLTPERNSAMAKAMAMAMEINATESGSVDAACVLDAIELQIARAKEEALSRKEILEKVEKWMAAREEESWLEKYNKDGNRYNAGRGAHLTLKRAEKARALVNKLPAMMDTLASKILAWENERGIDFIYDGVRVLTILESYKVLRKDKEIQRKRQRDQKKHQGQLLTEQEAVYGSKPSPIKNPNVKKAPRLSYAGASNRKLSLGEPMLHSHVTPAVKAIPNIQTAKKNECINQKAPRLSYAGASSRRVSHAEPMLQSHVTPAVKVIPNTWTTKKNECIDQNRRKDDRHAASSSVQRRGLNRAGITTKQHSSNLSNAREAGRQLVRKPFSPLSSANPSKTTAANVMEDLNRKHDELWQKLLTINRTPPNIKLRAEQENRTPQKTPTTAPLTPKAISIPMQTAVTPASIKTTSIARVEEELEYSFEERRAHFVLPKSPLINVARV